MNVNKKLDRFKQWAGERMGGEVKTGVSDDFKSLEVEMGLRYDGKGFGSLHSVNANDLSRYEGKPQSHEYLREGSIQVQRGQ